MSRCEPITKPIPPMKDLTSTNITANVKILNNQCANPRLRYIMDRLVTHIHDFAREVQLSTDEWAAGLAFLIAAGQISDTLRNELILLSDTLGLSLLVDSIDHPRSDNATEGTVLGPFHTHDAPETSNGYTLHEDPDAERLFVRCTITDTKGTPLSNVTCDVWEGDSHGFYDVQNPNRTHADGRAILKSNADGVFYFIGVVPVSYPIPMDGPVGAMLNALGRHGNRPGHVHFMLAKEGYDTLVTALYPRGDPYESSDPVFGVKDSLIVDLGTVSEEVAREYGVQVGMKMLSYDFVLVSADEARALKEEKAKEAARRLGLRMKLVDGLIVPDVD